MDSTAKKTEKDQREDDTRTPKKKSRKRKEKKSRKRSINPDELPKSGGISSTGGGSKRRKHSHDNNSNEAPTPAITHSSDKVSNEQMMTPTVASTKTKKKKKSKKKAKRSKKSTDEVLLGDDDEPSSNPNDVLLEGEMVGDTMVLVDKINGIVFSALNCNENDGSRVQVGSYVNGKVELFPQGDGTKRADGHGTTTNNDETVSDFPFEVDPDDHCESPLEAYRDVVPLLRAAASFTSGKLEIYDPYFCNGAVVQNLRQLGFPNVYNRKEDCYQVWKDELRYPKFDILVTNPPYSADHMEHLFRHLTTPSSLFPSNRPWLLLLPQWVHKKDYYLEATKNIQPFYLVPKGGRRYIYLPPPFFRNAKKSDTHKKSSPFVSMWYIWGGTPAQNSRWLELARRQIMASTCDVARSKSALRDLRRKGKK